MRLTENQLAEYRDHKDHGVEVEQANSIRFNSGSETLTHACAKTIVGYIGVNNGYIVNSEVDMPQGKQADVVLWGNPDRLSYVVECETSPQQETINEKREFYVENTSIDDMFVVNCTQLPADRFAALKQISDTLGLEP